MINLSNNLHLLEPLLVVNHNPFGWKYFNIHFVIALSYLNSQLFIKFIKKVIILLITC